MQDGDKVEAGQPLVILSDTQARSQLEIAQSQYFINRAMEVRLLAEQQGAETLEMPEELMSVDNERIQQVTAVQQSLFHARRQSLLSTLDSMDQQIIQMQEQIEGLEARERVNNQRISSLRSEAEDFRSLYREGLGDNQRLRELERQILQYQGDNAEFQSNIAQLRSQISENRMQKRSLSRSFRLKWGATTQCSGANSGS